jgi:vitamin B12 transporter
MKFPVPGARLAMLSVAVGAAFPTFSQTVAQGEPQLRETVVTATRGEQPIGDVIGDVTIIDRQTIERAGPVGLADLLARVPGFQITRNGGIGTTTSMFVRGGESRHTPVMIDGVRVESQTTSGGASWSTIPLSQIERIEIVRGPSSAVYGSDAVAGMIQIFTRKGQGPFAPSVTIGYGTYNTSRTELAASGIAGAFDYSFGVTQQTSNGFNARPVAGQNPDLDGYKSMSANTKVGFQINRDHRLEANILQSRMDSQYDQGLTRDYRRISDVQTIGAQWMGQWTPEYSTRLSLTQGTDATEEALNGSTPLIAFDKTRMRTFLIQNDYKLGGHLFTALYENRQDNFRLVGSNAVPAGQSAVNRNRSLDSFALGYGWSGGRNTLQLNMRHDKDSEFGGKTTGSAGYAFAMTPAWKVSAGAGTSFRVPTLYQRFSIYGPGNLVPESGRNVEASLKYAQGTAAFGVTAYRNRLTNLLSFVNGLGPCPNGQITVLPAANRSCYANTSQALYEGLTFTAAETVGGIHIYGSLDLQNPRNLVTKRTLQRRSNRFATIGADMRVGNWTFASDILSVSDRRESDTSPIILNGYTLVNFSATTSLSREWKLLAKLDNLTDKVYQTANGYASPRRTLYVAVTWAP